MPATSKPKASGSGQAGLAAFGFKSSSTATTTKKEKEKEKAKDEDEEDDDDEGIAEEEEDIDMPVKSSKKPSKAFSTIPTKKIGRPDQSSLPPLTDIPQIFADLVNHIPAIIDLARKLGGRKIRVATMCSGTESPLLALDLIARTLKKDHGVELAFEHIFSCEIVPWKQAYIERNFQPPLLFRDVVELGCEEATTAYGAKATVPLDVDMLVAGTSCVDYSTLNNAKQDIDAKGESGETFRGMMRWVVRAQPAIVILENVCSAPWPKVQNYFHDVNYSAAFSRFDTKNYYIPHTRTRVYLFAVRGKGSGKPDRWLSQVKALQRPASAPYDAFLLPADDPRIQQGREKLVREEQTGRTRTIDWAKCETRHMRARNDEELGNKRPLTNWNENGTCKMQDFAWIDWANAQVDRVWDLMDISFMRAAAHGQDATYKSILWNLSQNVDRQIGSSVAGISPCMTPTMIAYLNFRGGPMLGVEALGLQGLPVDELVLTRETEDNLADLAGNAMSSTVVGAAMLAALTLCESMLLKEVPELDDEEMKDGGAMIVEVQDENQMIPGETKISGLDQLTETPLDLAKMIDMSLSTLLDKAKASARLCACEGRVGQTQNTLSRCLDCDHTSCSRCGGRPEHKYELIDVVKNPRVQPLTFQKEVKDVLPMCVKVTGWTSDMIDALRVEANGDIPDKIWKPFRTAALQAVSSDLRFQGLKRQAIWIASYESPKATMEFHLDPKQPHWILFGKPDDDEPMNSPVRRMLAQPIGRLDLTNKLLEGRWKVALPIHATVQLKIEGVGEEEGGGLALSWEHRLGLQNEAFKDKKVWAKLKISLTDDADKEKLDVDVTGIYRWLPECAAAMASLHVKEGTPSSEPSLFFFQDACKWGQEDEDVFVFSTTYKRFDYGEARPVFATLDASYRQSDTRHAKTYSCQVASKWTPAPAIQLLSSGADDVLFASPTQTLNFHVDNGACCSAQAILTSRVRLPKEASDLIWPTDRWNEIDKVHERQAYKAIAFVTERLKEVAHQGDWKKTGEQDASHEVCKTCSPDAPVVRWMLDSKGKGRKNVIGIEDPQQAGVYEQALKRRPTPFVTLMRRDSDDLGHFRVGINIAALTHRVISRLPRQNRAGVISTSYRITTDYIPPAKLIRPKFTLGSNKKDEMHDQPPGFRKKLRPEQRRSLTWMVAQERSDAKKFEEEEIAEAIIEPLGWRAEAKATREVRVRGGVLADEVGYGKTVITLGLIASTKKKEWKKPSSSITKGLIPVKGTLIIVPPHLPKQWESEIVKFTKDSFVHVVIYSISALGKATIDEIMEADIVVVPSNLFSSVVYLARLAALGSQGPLPANFGRYFRERLSKTLDGLKDQTRLLQDEKVREVYANMEEGAKIDTSLQNVQKLAPSKRLRGVQFRTMAEARVIPGDKSKVPKLTGKRMKDVYIDVLSSELAPASSSSRPQAQSNGKAASNDVEMDSDDAKATRRRKAAITASLVESDDEDASAAPLKRRKTSSKKAEMDDFIAPDSDSVSEAESVATSSSDVNSDAMSEEEDEKPKAKSKPKAKATVKPPPKKASAAKAGSKRKNPPAASDAEGASGKKAPKKPKAEPKAKVDYVKQDPWKLSSSAVRKDWGEMKGPALEMFHWDRIVIDEYTYLKEEAHALITQLHGTRRWILSGTPPIHSFASLKTIAVFLGVHLGVDDEDENPTSDRSSERTAVEKFHSFREVRSVDWYAHRYEVGQRFLDQYVRQNIAEIDEIRFQEHIELINLPAAERALERELDHTLRAQDMMLKRGKKTQSDRDQRIMKSLRESESAEEALLKCVAYYDNVQSGSENAMKACDYVVKVRKGELDACQRDIYKTLVKLEKQRRNLGKVIEETHYKEWIRNLNEDGVTDHQATDIVKDIYEHAAQRKPWKADGEAEPESSALSGDEDDAKQKGLKGGKKVDPEQKKANAIWRHRETTHQLRQLVRELVGRVRSYRYFEAVRDIQKEHTTFTIDCPRCKRVAVPKDEISLLSSCGHMGCSDCVRACAMEEKCIVNKKSECTALAQLLNIVPAVSLGTDDEIKDAERHFGKKLEVVVDLIKHRIPKDERAILFIQYQDLMKNVLKALTSNDIPCLQLQGTAQQQSEKLTHFQGDNAKEKVLLLSLEDESASGANLTVANHVIFLSPMFAKSKEHYKATETQAIGRVRRYGQVRQVNVWRFVARDTMDVEIYERFTGRNFQREQEELTLATATRSEESAPERDNAADGKQGEDALPEDDGKIAYIDVAESSTESGMSSHPSPVSTTADVRDEVAGMAMSSDEEEMDVNGLIEDNSAVEDGDGEGMDLDKDKDLELMG